ncbi:hypothetical protein C9E82_05100 [Paracoccus siganidrum]|uniref:Uncharacterized protein n=1 Tax=Paracoccus siganidrum TaxID=1276757 RepID=A0A419A6P2_9RHOB|nr:hypothetical protein D3P05_10820 [Paracoccus siganidrum]RMC39357.1 hypothetical protein C9E82_05100 [Paracoccus siganidrum]
MLVRGDECETGFDLPQSRDSCATAQLTATRRPCPLVPLTELARGDLAAGQDATGDGMLRAGRAEEHQMRAAEGAGFQIGTHHTSPLSMASHSGMVTVAVPPCPISTST